MFLFLIGFAACLIGAVSGMGGGVIIKPVLDALTGLGAWSISLYSSVCVFVMAVASVIKRIADKSRLNGRVAALMGTGGVLGGLVGGKLFELAVARLENDGLVKFLQNAALLALLSAILAYMNHKRPFTCRLRGSGSLLSIGAGLGALSSFLGIGGGPINVAALRLFFGMEITDAAANSLVLIIFAQAAKLWVALREPGALSEINFLSLGLMALGAVLGGIGGAALSKRIQPAATQRVFNTVMLFVLLTCVVNIVRLFYTILLLKSITK